MLAEIKANDIDLSLLRVGNKTNQFKPHTKYKTPFIIDLSSRPIETETNDEKLITNKLGDISTKKPM